MMKKFIQYIQSLLDKAGIGKERSYYLILIVFLLVTLIIPERKMFFVASIFFLFGLFYALRDWPQVLFFGYFVLYAFPVGQVYRFVLVTEEELFFSSRYPFGKEAFFLLTPVFLVGALLIITVLWMLISFSRRRVFSVETMLFGFCVFLKFLSSIFSQYNRILSVLWLIGLIEFYSWFLLTHFIIKNVERFKKMLVYTFLILTLFQGFGVFMQWLRQQPMGILIEGARSEAAQEISVDYFRPRGFFSHPNNMANEMMAAAMILIYGYFNINSLKSKRIFIVGIVIAVISIFLSQSRAGILSFVMGILPILSWYVITYKRFIIKLLRQNVSLGVTIAVLMLTTFVSVAFVSRAINTILYSMGEGGGFDVRNQLVQEAIFIIKENPLFGVGYGMFVPAAFDRNATGVLNWFPEAVHNGFLSMTSESGIFTLLVVLVIIIMLVRKIFTSNFLIYERLIFLGYFISQIMFMFFHPVDNIVSMNTIVVVMLMHNYETQKV